MPWRLHQFGHHPCLPEGHRVAALRFAVRSTLGHQRDRHTQQQQPLARRCRQRLVLERFPDREELALRSHPFGQQQVGQWRACGHHVAWGAGVDPLHEPG